MRKFYNNTNKGFKPCYKWNTFNTCMFTVIVELKGTKVLNLVISGIPSILVPLIQIKGVLACFKPCYKWNTFNTETEKILDIIDYIVLNLVISGIPSILDNTLATELTSLYVLNLVISGIPSIQENLGSLIGPAIKF